MAFAMALAACASHPPAPSTHDAHPAPAAAVPAVRDVPDHPVLLISIDGFRPDYLDRGLTPTLARMAGEGARPPYMLPSFPSLTFPNHYTLVTGRVPDRNGIVNNTMRDPALGSFSLGNRQATSDGRWWGQAEPIWVTAQKQGLTTATMFWPGTEAEIHGVRPDRWLAFDGKMTSDARVDTLLQWLDAPGAKPAFDTLYFDAVDHAGHDYGPYSTEVGEALREVDHAMARLVDGLRQRGLYDRMNIVVVSDHGMADVPVGNTVFLDDIVKPANVDVVNYGVVTGLNVQPNKHAARTEARLLSPHEHMHCYRREALPARLDYGHNPRVPDILCLADTGWSITSHAALAARKGRPMSRGEHGYDNQDPSMRALFIGHGPAFARGGSVAPFQNVDVYPLLAHLLGISPLPNDGHLDDVKGLLVPSAR